MSSATRGRAVRWSLAWGQWSEQASDIRALRRFAQDGPLSVDPGSRGLLTASLSVATVQHDTSGNVRLVKQGQNNTARDDVAAALILAAGALSRAPQPRTVTLHVGSPSHATLAASP